VEFEKDAGDDGGARRDKFRGTFWFELAPDWTPFPRAVDPFPSEPGTILFPPFCNPKHDRPEKQPAHLLRC
jgi:hypothetical protein